MGSNSILIRKHGAGPFGGLSKDKFVQNLTSSLQGRVSAAYIFGSVSSGTYNEDSDVDIIVIKETETPFFERAREFDDIYDLAPAVDLLVYTPSEFAELLRETAGFWKSVKSTLVQIV